jgi:hypothetical protein
MTHVLHKFMVERDDEDVYLTASFFIDNSRASIEGKIYLSSDDDDNLEWEDTLSTEELEAIEDDVFERYQDDNSMEFVNDVIEEDFFHDEREIRLANGGKLRF